MVNGRRLDARQSTANARMVNGQRSDARWLTLGCLTTDGQTTTDDDRPMMTDTCRVHHEANADDLALRCAPTALVNQSSRTVSMELTTFLSGGWAPQVARYGLSAARHFFFLLSVPSSLTDDGRMLDARQMMVGCSTLDG